MGFSKEDSQKLDTELREGQEAALQLMKAKYHKEMVNRMVSWDKIQVSLDTFPYYLDSNTKELLVDCALPYVCQPDFMEYSEGLSSASRSFLKDHPKISGSLLYQEELVKALAHHLKASFLSLDSAFLHGMDYGDEDFFMEPQPEDEFLEAGGEARPEKGTADSAETQKEAVDVDLQKEKEEQKEPAAEVLNSEDQKKDDVDSADQKKEAGDSKFPQVKFKKGDQVRFVGTPKKEEGSSQDSKTKWALKSLKKGQRGCAISTPKGLSNIVAVRFQSTEGSFVYWCHSAELELADRPGERRANEWVASLEALREFSAAREPLVAYFPDPEHWVERAVPPGQRQAFLDQVEEQLGRISAPVILVAARATDDCDTECENSEEEHAFWFSSRIKSETIYSLFANTVTIYPPKDGDKQLQDWKQGLERDKAAYTSRTSLQRVQKVLELHNLKCQRLSDLSIMELELSYEKIEKVVGWARNHYLTTNGTSPCTVGRTLSIPVESLQRAMSRLKAQEGRENSREKLKALAKDYEKKLLSSVILASEVGVLFDDIGALEDVKKTLQELVILPLRRPELFRRGNLTKPCRGVLLFGPPGTGKTLLAKAIATEAGANFMSVTSSTILSKWYGDAEKLTKAVFTLARKLSPTVIFVDEVDSLLGSRGGCTEHEASRRVKNEFMAAWDGLRTKDDVRIVVLAATNRPFDLDDAVIRRLSRRILVDVPAASARAKILGVILAKEKLEDGFDLNEVARITEGYSGSDLKNLAIAAAYGPIRDFLAKEEELKQKGEGLSGELIRPISMEDFGQAMTQVSASVPFDAPSMKELRQWNKLYGEGGSRKVRW